MALKNDGTVVAWGNNDSGQTTIPSGLSGVVAISAGYGHSVALKGDGTVVAWGNNDSGQTTVPAGLSGVVSISAGVYYTVALKGDGTVVAWGYNGLGQTKVPTSPYETSLPGTVTWDQASLTATLVPTTSLPGSATIKALLSQGIKSQINSYHLNAETNWNFTTASLPVSIFTSLLANGYVGFYYNKSLAAANGATPYSWSIASGTLPAGLTLSTAGIISGTPTSTGTKSVTFRVTDAGGKTATKTLSITINAAPLSITTASLADEYINGNYIQTLVARGGKSPYTWSIASGTLPENLTLAASTGIISGVAVTSSGTSTFTVQVKDANNSIAARELTISAYDIPIISNTSLPSGVAGKYYSQALTATGGKPPYTYSSSIYSFGNLPDGLSIDASSGSISGVPTTAANNNVDFNVIDVNSKGSGTTLSLTIAPAISISTSSLPDGYLGNALRKTLSATGGTPPYKDWSIIGGSLPAGLSLDANSGVISGTPANTGDSNFTVQVKDSDNVVANKPLTMKIIPFASINGIVTDQATGGPLPAVNVTLALTGISSKDPDDKIFTCNDVPLTATDYNAVAANDSIKFNCSTANYHVRNTMLFKVRNPYGTDSFTVSWNGISALAAGSAEYLAQRFSPTKNGKLTKVSFYLPSNISTHVQGNVHVLLKSKLGGDRGTYLAMSDKVNLSPLSTGAPMWVDFTFPTPVSITAGQEYFLEINGTYFEWISGGGYLYDLNWSYSTDYTSGISFSRKKGLWSQNSCSLAFRTYLDDQADLISSPAASVFNMDGGNDAAVSAAIINPSSGGANNFSFNTSLIDSDGYHNFNGDDLTGLITVISGIADYYDQNGWITAKVFGYSSDAGWQTDLVTDEFSLTFNRTLAAVTDANGAYSFQNLPDGNYTITFGKAAYANGSSDGTISPGQIISLNKGLIALEPATLHGTVTLSAGAPLAGVAITVTDPLGARSAVSDSQGNYLVCGIAPGNYTITFEGAQLQSTTQTGSLSTGQMGVLNVVMSPAAVSLTIASPADGSVVSVLPLAVTGTALNADSVNLTTTNNGTVTNFAANIVNGIFSSSILLTAGQTRIDVSATSKYGQSAVKGLNVTTAPFLVRNLGDTGNVTVMEASGDFDAKNADGSLNDQPRRIVATEYFRTHGDVDFLVMQSTFDYALPEAGAQGFYLGVKNDVQGINQAIFDNSSLFGSLGRLQGTIDTGNVSALAAAPYGPKLDQTVTTLNHELMHRFGAYVRYKNPYGTMNTALLGKDSAHWSYLLDTQGSLMYGNGWKDYGNGTFTSISKMSGYSPLDLYLMGMIAKEQVPPMLLIDNPAIDKTQLPQLGAIITGTAKTVTIDDIIAAEGARIPDSASSQKKFNVGFVLLVRPGDSATAAVQAIETVRTAFTGRFAELTQGTGGVNGVTPSVSVVIDSPADGATITGPDVTVTGAVINTTGAETGVTVNGIPAAVSGSRFIVNHVPLQTGSNTISITATDANGLTTSATRSVNAAAGNYIRITSNIESGVAPLDISLTLDGSFTIANPTVTLSAQVLVPLTAGTNQTEFTATLTVEGIYTFTASAVGPDGQTYSDSVTITVISKNQLESLIKAKWEGMKAAVINGTPEAVLNYFVPGIQGRFRAIFNDPSSHAATRLSEISKIKLFSAKGRAAQAGAIRMELDGEYAYPVNFVKDGDGLWKILGF
jgi:hypothetical protein